MAPASRPTSSGRLTSPSPTGGASASTSSTSRSAIPSWNLRRSDPLVQAVERAAAAGIVVVTSAGNIGRIPAPRRSATPGITSPGNAPSAITVGALNTHGTVTRQDDDVAPFSSRGPTWYDGDGETRPRRAGHTPGVERRVTRRRSPRRIPRCSWTARRQGVTDQRLESGRGTSASAARAWRPGSRPASSR